MLQIANVNCKDSNGDDKQTCPALTLRKQRCRNTRDAASYIEVQTVLNSMSLRDPSDFLREDEQLVRLANQVLCRRWHLHMTHQKQYVISLWRKLIQEWIRAQAPLLPPPVDVDRGSNRGESVVIPSIEHDEESHRHTPPARQDTRSPSPEVSRRVRRETDEPRAFSRSLSPHRGRSSTLQGEPVVQAQQRPRISDPTPPLAVADAGQDPDDTPPHAPPEGSRSLTLDHAVFDLHLREARRRRSEDIQAIPQASMDAILRNMQELTTRVRTLEEERAADEREMAALRRENSLLSEEAAQQRVRIAVLEEEQDELEEEQNEMEEYQDNSEEQINEHLEDINWLFRVE